MTVSILDRHMSILPTLTLCFLPVVLLSGCQKSATVIPGELKTEITVRAWDIVGPFRFHSGDISPENPNRAAGGLNHDFLGDLGSPESTINAGSFHRLAGRAPRLTSFAPQGALVPLDSLFPEIIYAAAYAGSEIVSKSDLDVGIATGSDDGQKIWLNGQLLISTPNTFTSAAVPYDRLAIAHLRRGKNFLLVKTDQKTAGWRFYLSIIPLSLVEETTIKVAENRNDRLLRYKLVSPGQPLSIAAPFADKSNEMSISVTDSDGKRLYSASIPYGPETTVPLPADIPGGIYDVSLTGRIRTTSFTVLDSFFVGDPGVLYKQLLRFRNRFNSNDRAFLAANVLLKRFDILNRPEYRQPEDTNWQNKLLFVLREGSMAVRSRSGLSWTSTPGLHLREFISRIDGQPQNYALIVPPHSSGPMPVILSLPANQSNPLPFLAGPRLAYPQSLEALKRTAFRHGAALVMLNGRGNAYGAPIGEADVLEVLKDVQNSFPIDRRRIYLWGECSGAQRALLLAEHHPSLFAAVGLYGLGARGTGDIYPGMRGTIDSLLANLRNTPVFMLNGDKDDRCSIVEAKKLYEAMKSAGVPVAFQVLPGGEHTDDREPEIVFSFLTPIAREQTPGTVFFRTHCANNARRSESFWLTLHGCVDPQRVMEIEASYESGRFAVSTNNIAAFDLNPAEMGIRNGSRLEIRSNGLSSDATYRGRPITVQPHPASSSESAPQIAGSVNEAFGEPFLVVAGAGPAGIQAASAFRDSWRQVFFVECRVKRDIDVTEDDVHSYNLVLFGEPSPRSVLARARSGISVRRHGSKLMIGEKAFTGSTLGYVSVWQNPLDRRRYLVLADGLSDKGSLLAKELAIAGTYQYSVWDSNGSQLDAGAVTNGVKRALRTGRRPGVRGQTARPLPQAAATTRIKRAM